MSLFKKILRISNDFYKENLLNQKIMTSIIFVNNFITKVKVTTFHKSKYLFGRRGNVGKSEKTFKRLNQILLQYF